MKKTLFTLIGALLLNQTSHATALAQLKAFIASTQTLTARFEQVVSAKLKQDKASGTVAIARPGRFRWVYAVPYQQIIVGDGKQLWIYDKDLNQISSSPLNTALGSSPAALLAGDNEALRRHYHLVEAPRLTQDKLDWLIATPKEAQAITAENRSEHTFKSMRMGFKDNLLVEMEFVDYFGNTTRIRFTDVQTNPPLDPALFVFTPPAGVDVMYAPSNP